MRFPQRPQTSSPRSRKGSTWSVGRSLGSRVLRFRIVRPRARRPRARRAACGLRACRREGARRTRGCAGCAEPSPPSSAPPRRGRSCRRPRWPSRHLVRRDPGICLGEHPANRLRLRAMNDELLRSWIPAYPKGVRPATRSPRARFAARPSAIRSAIISRSNWANVASVFSWNCAIADDSAKEPWTIDRPTPCSRRKDCRDAKSETLRVNRSKRCTTILCTTSVPWARPAAITSRRRSSAGRPSTPRSCRRR